MRFISFTACALLAATTIAQADERASVEQIALARNICSDVMRIRQGFVSFYACVESLSQTIRQKNSNRMVSKGTSASYAINRPQEISYSDSNAEERRRKEEYSCAQLGILPGSPGFGQCVAELDGSLRSVEQSE